MDLNVQAPRLFCVTAERESRIGSTRDEDDPWLTPEQQREWRALLALLMTLPAAMDAQLKRDAGVNAFEYQLLAALGEAPDRTRVLSDLATLAQGSLSRIWVSSLTLGVSPTCSWLETSMSCSTMMGLMRDSTMAVISVRPTAAAINVVRMSMDMRPEKRLN